MSQNPSIFVSSTCYDLKQVRVDLKEFIESLGCEPILSEYDNFPGQPGDPRVANIVLKLTVPDLTEYEAEMDRVNALMDSAVLELE